MRLRPLLALFIPLLLLSCGLFTDRRVDVPPTPILTGGSGWVIVKSSYVRLKAAPDALSSDVAALRDGTLAEVRGSEFDKTGSPLWYRVRTVEGGQSGVGAVEGWVAGGDLDLFASRAQADKALKDRRGGN
jgi:hypothetical protein